MSDGRSRRAAKPTSKAKSSLAQLAELRRTGAKRVHDFELTEEEAVYDEVQEQDYAQLVQDRREQAGQDIVLSMGRSFRSCFSMKVLVCRGLHSRRRWYGLCRHR